MSNINLADEDYIRAILKNDPDQIVATAEVEPSQDPNRESELITFKDGTIARYSRVQHAAYIDGVVHMTRPKQKIEILNPIERTIYSTDWMDDLEKSNSTN